MFLKSHRYRYFGFSVYMYVIQYIHFQYRHCVWFKRLVLFAYMWCIVCIHNFDYDRWNILVCFDLDHMLYDFRFVLLGINFALCIFDIHRYIWLLLLNMIQILYSYVFVPTRIKRENCFWNFTVISFLKLFWLLFGVILFGSENQILISNLIPVLFY